ncbi:hypothetical protein E1B28_010604 [Marasmius oreades]|uniref:AB hydrolase-1 domain-containing protein n=1 Tax=Marasmius oreades TaxID=181124 RepID=A0A9P7RY48_9AGAR|nr:uncharacterized protein E1B28_010604 [Marasmius oreades]KAG7091582.1 hypothetical protein E1B28_010604 [Marasmius oreades]
MVFSNTFTIADDIQLYYTDSGAPPNFPEYTTLLVLHGYGFGGAGFEAMQSHCHDYNLRVVVVNRRDYRGSTPFTDSELEEVRQGNPIFLERLAVHLVMFLKQFIEKENIPVITDNRKGGGLAIMGWSLGALTAIAPFSNPDLYDEETRVILERYVKGLILYDPAYAALGCSIPPKVDPSKLYTLWTDPDAAQMSPEEAIQKGLHWGSSYYQYTVTSEGVPTLESFEKTASLCRTENSLADSWTQNDAMRMLDPEGSHPLRADTGLLAPQWQAITKDAAHRALLNESLAQKFLPQLSVLFLYAPHSPWMAVLAHMETYRIYQEHVKRKEAIRLINFVKLTGANHFMHVANPKLLLEVIAGNL